VHGRQRDQVVFVKLIEVQQRVPDLLDVDRAREGDLLAVVALELGRINECQWNVPEESGNKKLKCGWYRTRTP